MCSRLRRWAGPYDVTVRAEARSIDALGRLIESQLQAIDGVTRSLTCSVVHLYPSEDAVAQRAVVIVQPSPQQYEQFGRLYPEADTRLRDGFEALLSTTRPADWVVIQLPQ